MFAIVSIAGHQYCVKKNDTLTVSHLDGDVGSLVTFPALLTSDGEKVVVGTPTVANLTVSAKITKQRKGEKINVRRYKQKVRYRRSIGFRPLETELFISSIG